VRKFFAEKFTKSSIFRGANELNSKDQIKLLLITIVQIFIGFLDLAGVIVIAALGALSVQGIESKHAGNKVGSLLKFFHIETYTFHSQVAFLGIFAGIVLVLKTLLSIFFIRKIFYFLSIKSAQISADLVSKFLSRDLIQVQRHTTQEILFIISEGVRSLMIGVLATSITIASDFAMLLILSIGLFFIDPSIAIATAIIFFITAYILHYLLQIRSRQIGSEYNRLTVQSNQKILEVLNSYRESVVRNRRAFYANKIRTLRYEMGEINAEWNFQPYISKYVIELTTVIGAIVLAGFEFSTKNATHAVSVLAVFLATSSRIGPAVLRIQQSLLTVRNSTGSATTTFQLIDELKNTKILDDNDDNDDADLRFDYPNFIPEVVLQNLSFSYGVSSNFSLENISLVIPAGSSAALVGPSGAGKTTMVDLILGVLQPNSGFVKISGLNPIEASRRWGGGISYVPQDIAITTGTIRDNVSLGYRDFLATDARVWSALHTSQLDTEIQNFPNGLDENIGENGYKISGGQRQRLGIARALFTSPKLLVLDEATSSLDGQTESDLTESIKSLSGKVTIITVAHRLSTVRAVDKVIYIDRGKVIATGTFEEVRKKVPNFDKQAMLMGL
jgi:ATP-binding cassette subfamily C protein